MESSAEAGGSEGLETVRASAAKTAGPSEDIARLGGCFSWAGGSALGGVGRSAKWRYRRRRRRRRPYWVMLLFFSGLTGQSGRDERYRQYIFIPVGLLLPYRVVGVSLVLLYEAMYLLNYLCALTKNIYIEFRRRRFRISLISFKQKF